MGEGVVVVEVIIAVVVVVGKAVRPNPWVLMRVSSAYPLPPGASPRTCLQAWTSGMVSLSLSLLYGAGLRTSSSPCLLSVLKVHAFLYFMYSQIKKHHTPPISGEKRRVVSAGERCAVTPTGARTRGELRAGAVCTHARCQTLYSVLLCVWRGIARGAATSGSHSQRNAF